MHRALPLVFLIAILIVQTQAGRCLERFDFEQRYFMEPGLIAADHAILIEGSEYHLFYTVGVLGEGWGEPGNMIDFGHASSTDLIHWQVHDRVIPIEAPGWKERNVWAPHIMRDFVGEGLLYYTGVDSSIAQQIGVASSQDLFNWAEIPSNPVYRPDPTWASWQAGQWSNCRDPFVMRISGQFAMITTASTRPGYLGIPESRGAISLAFSQDGLHWTDAGAPLFINDSFRVLESTYMLKRLGTWYLFFNEAGIPGVRYMTSGQPFSSWDKTTAQMFEFEGFAAEVFEKDGEWLFARVRDGLWNNQTILGIKVDPLHWNGTTPVIADQSTLRDNWTIVSGDAFDFQPTFGDRPRDRTGDDSNVEGFFWINTAEQHAGPLEWGCPECPPDPAPTGIMQSRSFQLTASHITMRLGGGDDPDHLYVALVRASDAAKLRVASGLDNDIMRLVIWDVSDLEGETVYIEIADLRATGPFGHISVDAIEETNDPPITTALDDTAASTATGAVHVVPMSPTRAPVRFVIDTGAARTGGLRLYDAAGRQIRVLGLEALRAGRNILTWDGRTSSGAAAAPGVYFYLLPGAPDAHGKFVLTR